MNSCSEILLGMGSSLDYEMPWDPQAITALARDWGIDSWPAPPERIKDERDLLCAILAYSAAGVGTERAVDSVEVIESVARELGFKESLGGTGVRAGQVLDLLGIGCTVHLSSVIPQTELLLWHGATYITGQPNGAVYPHLLVQFREDESITVGGVTRTPPRPNRLIFVNDPDNAKLALAPELATAIARSSIWLISGLNASASVGDLSAQLDTLRDLTATMGPGGWIVYEDSGFHREELSAIAMSAMAAVCDVVSMNEDEFAKHLVTPVDLADPAAIRAGLLELADRWMTTDIVVHTAHWAAAVGPHAQQVRSALTSGVLAAGARFLHGDAMTQQNMQTLLEAPVSAVGADVAMRLERSGITAVPGLHLSPSEPVTVGLGDSFVGGFLAGLHGRKAPSSRTGGSEVPSSPVTSGPVPR